jgi:hypothetical protein
MSAAGAAAADEALLPAAARGAVFDLDGTILDTMQHHWEAWSQTAGEYGCAAAARPPARPRRRRRGPLRPPAAGR